MVRIEVRIEVSSQLGGCLRVLFTYSRRLAVNRIECRVMGRDGPFDSPTDEGWEKFSDISIRFVNTSAAIKHLFLFLKI